MNSKFAEQMIEQTKDWTHIQVAKQLVIELESLEKDEIYMSEVDETHEKIGFLIERLNEIEC